MKKTILTLVVGVICAVSQLKAQSNLPLCFENTTDCNIEICLDFTTNCVEVPPSPVIFPPNASFYLCHTLLPGEVYCFSLPPGYENCPYNMNGMRITNVGNTLNSYFTQPQMAAGGSLGVVPGSGCQGGGTSIIASWSFGKWYLFSH